MYADNDAYVAIGGSGDRAALYDRGAETCSAIIP